MAEGAKTTAADFANTLAHGSAPPGLQDAGTVGPPGLTVLPYSEHSARLHSPHSPPNICPNEPGDVADEVSFSGSAGSRGMKLGRKRRTMRWVTKWMDHELDDETTSVQC